jgi:hypothetical protein
MVIKIRVEQIWNHPVPSRIKRQIHVNLRWTSHVFLEPRDYAKKVLFACPETYIHSYPKLTADCKQLVRRYNLLTMCLFEQGCGRLRQRLRPTIRMFMDFVVVCELFTSRKYGACSASVLPVRRRRLRRRFPGRGNSCRRHCPGSSGALPGSGGSPSSTGGAALPLRHRFRRRCQAARAARASARM